MGAVGADWQARGYCGTGNVRPLIGSLSTRTAIVAGAADGVFDEVAHALRMFNNEPVIFAANDVGMYLPRVDHWVSLHADNIGIWKAVRWLHPGEYDTKYHSIDKRPFIDYVWSGLTPLFCISGYFAMQIAWIMGAEPIILAGCPGDGTRRFFEATPRVDFKYGADPNDSGPRDQLVHEMDRLPHFKSAVRSTSGWTQEFFGGI
jgi:hypothetical protein